MKLKVCPLADIAAHDALTAREWEALGRLAVRLENFHSEADLDLLKRLPSEIAVSTVHHIMVNDFIELFEEAGLEPEDWFVYIAPIFPKAVTLPDYIDEWMVHIRLVVDQTTAKRDAQEGHAPTLSEQHGRGKA